MPARVGKRRRSRGSAYVLVLAAAVLLSVIGMGLLSAARIRGHSSAGATDAADALAYARSALEVARLQLKNEPTWRTDSAYANSAWVGPQAIGRGTLSWKVVDESTGNLNSYPTNPVRLYGKGTAASSTQIISVQLTATVVPYDSVLTAVHSATSFNVTASTYNVAAVVLTATNGPVSTAGQLTNSGTITGSAVARSFTGGGTISGTSTTLATAKSMPASTVFTDYVNRGATVIPWNTTNFVFDSTNNWYRLNVDVLTPTVSAPNTLTLNSDGLYLIQVPANASLDIDKCRLDCTILVDVGSSGGSLVHVGGQILWGPHRSDYPMLIVRGASNVELDAWGNDGGPPGGLSESILGKNFNPAGFPYNGVSDTNTSGAYTAQLSGVIHIIGSSCQTAICTRLRTNGCIICEGPVVYPTGLYTADSVLTWNSTLSTAPPLGYYTVNMVPNMGTFARSAGP